MRPSKPASQGCSWFFVVLVLLLLASAITGIVTSIVLLVPTVPPSSSEASNGLLPSLAPTRAANQSYNIEFRFSPVLSAQDTYLFEAARSAWTQVISQDVPSSIEIVNPADACGLSGFADETVIVDDLLILIQVVYIDGLNGILGQAGPCAVDESLFSRVGVIQIDSADFAKLKQDGTAQAVILHEIGHVIGIGTLWDDFNLVPPSASPTGFAYQGTEGNLGHVQVGGVGNAIVEDTGGPGTVRSHWKESVYANELMTGFLTGSSQPLSKLTARSLKDIGLFVDLDKADAYTIPVSVIARQRLRPVLKASQASQETTSQRIGDDVWKGPRTILKGSKPKFGREAEFNRTLERASRIKLRKAKSGL